MLSVVILIEVAQKTFNYWCLWKEKCCFAGKKNKNYYRFFDNSL